MTLVIGPSGAGKSTYLKSIGAEERTVYAFENPGPEAEFIHYNMLSQAYLIKAGKIPEQPLTLRTEARLIAILDNCNVDNVLVLVTPVHELLARAKTRANVEDRYPEMKYQSDTWKSLIETFDFFAAYEQLFEMLKERGIGYSVMYSDATHEVGSFAPSDRVYIHQNLRGIYVPLPDAAALNAQLQSISENAYQTTLLPGGLALQNRRFTHVSGGRQKTFEMLTDRSLIGRSVLDIGCANGDFLFRAERYGATRLLGYDLKTDRIETAKCVADALKSAAEFHNMEFMHHEGEEQFDDVLLLNVIHHVSDFRGLILKAAALTRGRMIIEYPTLNDARFQSLSPVQGDFSALPIVGVSSKGVDQTFVFTAPAIERIVAEIGGFHASLHPSPIPKREILVFERDG